MLLADSGEFGFETFRVIEVFSAAKKGVFIV